MPEPNQKLPIAEWKEGDRVSGYALVTRREVRQDKNANDYLVVDLADRSGSMGARAWSNSPALEADFAAHDFVAVQGIVTSYRDTLQLKMEQCRRITEEDRTHGFDEALLIPSTRQDPEEMWQRLRQIYAENLRDPLLERLAAETLAAQGTALKTHPAAKTIHHAYRGGLLEHTVSMAELALLVSQHYEELDRDQLLIGVLFHDLGKLLEIGAMPANDYTEVGRLVGHVVLGRDLLRQQCAAIEGFPPELLLRLEHLVLSHQGTREYGSPVVPATPEAIALHFIDDLDAKLAMLRQAQQEGQNTPYLRALNRHVYLEPVVREPDAADESGGDGDEEDEDAEQTPLDL